MKQSFSWRFLEAKKVTVAPVNLEFNSTDSLVFKPAFTQTYTIRVFRKDSHIDTFEQTVEVRNRGIKYFSGDNCIWLGDQATLSWRTFGCDRTVIREPELICLLRGHVLFNLIRPQHSRLKHGTETKNMNKRSK